ncbi:MAG TPA: ADP-ribosylglycohydrolase family protein [Tepidisphaeraceae bacterium]|jgi:ADP-ribosylglycohydrolase
MTDMNEIDPAVLSRARGCLLGQVAGDSLGALVEFQDAESIRVEYPQGVRELRDGGHWDLLAGQPTDDSELALMLARTLAREGRYEDDAVARAYGAWYSSPPFDCGGTIARALSVVSRVAENHAAMARKVANRESQANGALMRVSPLGVFGHAMAPEALADLARRDASLTHPHSICQDASVIFVVTIARAVGRGGSPGELFEFARDWAARAGLTAEVRAALEDAAGGPPTDASMNMGWVRIALQNAFHRLAHGANVEEGVVATVMCGGDTDTNGAIAGALLGAIHGEAAIPRQWREAVLTCRPEAGRPGVRHPRPVEFWPTDLIELADRLVGAGARYALG